MNNIKTETVVAFLKARGWVLEKKDLISFILIPPAEFKPEPHARFYVPLPRFEKAKDFELHINLVLNTISELYEIEKEKLITLFSESLEEMRKETKMRKEILEFA